MWMIDFVVLSLSVCVEMIVGEYSRWSVKVYMDIKGIVVYKELSGVFVQVQRQAL